jgi:hypothetical protein
MIDQTIRSRHATDSSRVHSMKQQFLLAFYSTGKIIFAHLFCHVEWPVGFGSLPISGRHVTMQLFC